MVEEEDSSDGVLQQPSESGRYAPLPTVALSIRQPWAWLIVNGHKDIENRDWWTKFRGPVLIHAAKAWGPDERSDALYLDEGEHPVTGGSLSFVGPVRYDLGGIVGVAEIVDCVSRSTSPWFVGKFGFVIRNARPLPFMPLKGALGFFPASYLDAYDKTMQRIAEAPSPTPPAGDGWKPIETAPKDGRELIGHRSDQGEFVFRWAWAEEFVPKDLNGDPTEHYDEDFAWWWHDRWGWMEGEETPTHWRPLPPPPVSKGEKL
jgi:hypothetical protein